MSEGNFDFIADVYPEIITIDTVEPYGACNLRVLNTINQNFIDFSRYDNWKFEYGDFVFEEGKGDSFIDIIFILYRNTKETNFGLAGGIATLGFNDTIITHDGFIIDGYGPSTTASGITSINRNKMLNPYMYTAHLAHEYGHYLFGYGHTRVSGLMTGDPYNYDGGTYAMSSWEKYFIGYGSFYEANYDGYQRTLHDYVSNGDAVRVTIPFNNLSSNEYLLVENHQRLDLYDRVIRGGAIEGAWQPNYTYGKGIYIWYVRNGNTFPPNIVSIQADGGWDWYSPGYIQMNEEGWPDSLKLYDKGDSDIYLNSDTGKCDRNSDIIGTAYSERWHDINPLTKQWVLSRDVMGDETDAFNLAYNNQLTPWSNKSTTKLINGSEVPTNIAVQLISQNNNDITIKVRSTYNGCLSLPPSKPQKLVVTANENHNPLLNWISNKEPDMKNGKYRIYRAITTGAEPTSYTYLTEINAFQGKYPVNAWVDESIEVWGGNRKLFYKISAVDSTILESQLSDYDWVWFGLQGKEGHEDVSLNSFNLFQNYPNPFNPSTTITFSLKEECYVKLTIYNVMGEAIETLINNYYNSGMHKVNLNGNNLSSGIYLYKIEAINKNNESFSAFNKMILIK